MLREGILTSERVNMLTAQAEVFYRRLMSVVDDYGRYYAKPELLLAACYPLQIEKVRKADIGTWIGATCEAGLVRRYTVDGKDFLELIDFRQQVRAKNSKFPHPPNACVADATHTQCTCKSSAHLGEVEVEDDIPTANAVGVPVDAGNAPRIPDCPHEKIIALYHELLPLNPRVIEWNETRQGYLRARWKDKSQPGKASEGYSTERDGLAWWRRFLGWLAQSKFLTGQRDGTAGKPPFLADLEWIIKPTNFSKIIEGKYHR